MMPALWLLNTFAWGIVLVYMLPGAWNAAFGGPRLHDPWRLVCFSTALMMAGFSVRWLLAPDNMLLWQALYVLSAADAAYVVVVARAYGRGPSVDGGEK